MCLSLLVYVCVCPFLTVYVCLSLSVCLPVSVCLRVLASDCLRLPVSKCLPVSVSDVCLCLCAPVSLCLSLPVCLCLCVSVSLLSVPTTTCADNNNNYVATQTTSFPSHEHRNKTDQSDTLQHAALATERTRSLTVPLSTVSYPSCQGALEKSEIRTSAASIHGGLVPECLSTNAVHNAAHGTMQKVRMRINPKPTFFALFCTN